MPIKPILPDEGDWSRKHFAVTGFELDYQDALTALERILQRSELNHGLRATLTQTASELRTALD
jgi:hypothetical protein